MKYLIIGGVAGGATTAARMRRLDEHAEIILFERGKYVSYANCGLPYHIGGTIAERENLFVQTVEGFTDRFRIDIRTEQEVIRIQPDRREVLVRRLGSGEEYTESYDKLVLSPGADPLVPPIEGIRGRGIFTLRNVPDTDAIKAYIDSHRPRRAVVVGGGFIGLEMAENLHHRDIRVEVVEMADQVMAPLDFSMASIVHHHLADKGIGLHLSNGVARFEETPRGTILHLQSGETIHTDLVLLSIGVRPETKLAREAGLAIGPTGEIRVDEHLLTSNPHIYALGDAIEIQHHITGKPALIPLAGPANKQGRIVADNIVLGNRQTYTTTQGTSIAQVFDLTVAAAGASAKLLRREGIPYLSSYTHGSSHAGYYPGAVPLSIKILFAPEGGQLLGAQVVGFDGVDKRIEMLAQVIQRKGTVYDLMKLEHAYAPPYSSAKDPVHIAACVADNILTGKCEMLHWREVASLPEDTQCIDVRTRDEYALGHIPGFINIPVDELRERMASLSKNKPVVTTCAVGLRGYLAYRILRQNGFDRVRNLSGGYKTWSAATAPIHTARAEEPQENATACPMAGQAAAADTGKAPALQIDACGLMCPGPIMKLKKSYNELQDGEALCISATDQAFGKDVASWCKITGAQLEGLMQRNGIISATIRKSGTPAPAPSAGRNADHKTLIVFSDDLDKALASFVIANGAAAMGKKVTMFFTFWGLNVIKKQQKPTVHKDFFGKMFGMMLPAHSGKLKLSKLNMGGMGQ